MDKSKVCCYLLNIKEIDENLLLTKYKDNFEASRIEKIENCKNELRKKEMIATGALLSWFLSKEGLSASNISCKENGKPCFTDEKNLYFNLSNTKDYVFLCVCGQETGADIQKRVSFNKSLYKRITSESERENLFVDPVESFNHLWAVKESYAKLLGVGISMDMSLINCIPQGEFIEISDNGTVSAYSRLVFENQDVCAYVTLKEKAEEYILTEVVL